jgi:hypothetical protein
VDGGVVSSGVVRGSSIKQQRRAKVFNAVIKGLIRNLNSVSRHQDTTLDTQIDKLPVNKQ